MFKVFLPHLIKYLLHRKKNNSIVIYVYRYLCRDHRLIEITLEENVFKINKLCPQTPKQVLLNLIL